MTDLDRYHRVQMAVQRLADETRALWDKEDDPDLAAAFYSGLAVWDADDVRRLAADASAYFVAVHTDHTKAAS